MKKFTLGIDPGANTAIAVFHRVKFEICGSITTNFFGAISYLSQFDPGDVHMVIVELPTKLDKHGNKITNKKVWHETAKSKAHAASMGVNVGYVLREAELLIEWCTLNGYNVVDCNPQGKRDKEYLQRITGFSKKTNQHQRDAILMCYGI